MIIISDISVLANEDGTSYLSWGNTYVDESKIASVSEPFFNPQNFCTLGNEYWDERLEETEREREYHDTWSFSVNINRNSVRFDYLDKVKCEESFNMVVGYLQIR
jgi:hypothetical protein